MDSLIGKVIARLVGDVGEVSLAAGVFALAMLSGWVINPSAMLPWGGLLAAALSVCFAMDVRRLIIPDVITGPLIILGLAIHVLDTPSQILSHAAGAVVGYGMIWAVGLCFRLVRGVEGIGLGDAKLLAAAGAWLGLASLPFVIVIASTLALCYVCLHRVMRRTAVHLVAFGPFLAAGFWLGWLAPVLPISAGIAVFLQ